MTVDGICQITGKRGYPSRTEATRANHGLNRRKVVKGKPLSAYLCRACGAWHLGRER